MMFNLCWSTVAQFAGFRADATDYAVHGALSYYQKDHAPERVRAQ